MKELKFSTFLREEFKLPKADSFVDIKPNTEEPVHRRIRKHCHIQNKALHHNTQEPKAIHFYRK